VAESIEARRLRAERRAVIAQRRARRRRVAYRRAPLSSRRVEPAPLPSPRSIELPTPGGTGSMGVRRARQRYRELRRLGLDHDDAVRTVAMETGRTLADVARRTTWDARMADLQAEQPAPDNHNERRTR
jgi:hypothetical protein